MKILITGGHFTTAIATIEELLKSVGKGNIYFVGRKRSMEGDKTFSVEYRRATELRLQFFPLTTGRIVRQVNEFTLVNLAKFVFGFFQSLYLIVRIRPDVICSFGGYIGFFPSFWAIFFRVPLIIHEQTTKPGLANRISALWAKKITVSFRQAVGFFPSGKTEVIGNPIRKEVFQKRAKNKNIKAFLDGVGGGKLIYITGGNQGSHSINMVVKEILKKVLGTYFVIHQTGNSTQHPDFVLFSKISASLEERQKKYYLPVSYVESGDIGAVLNRADLVIGRSGANTVWEIATLRKPSILIPLAISAGGEQKYNADLLSHAGVSKVIDQDQLSPYLLYRSIEEIFARSGDMRQSFKKIRGEFSHGGAKKLSSLILHAAKKSA